MNKYSGSSFDDFLAKEGILKEISVRAQKRRLVLQIIDILQRRRTELRREQLAERIKNGREEYVKGEITRGSIDDLMKEISA